MHLTELLSQFRALGGIADNVRVGLGPYGCGLFVEDPACAVHIATPNHLLVSPQMLEPTAGGQIKVSPSSGCSAQVAAFHVAYQCCVGWGADGAASTVSRHQALCDLPENLKAFLRILGSPDGLFQMPSPTEAFQSYCTSRQIRVNGASQLMPVLELVNHADAGAPFVVAQDGVGLSGKFDDEVLACYRRQLDGFHFFFNYHFAARTPVVLSCEVRVDIPGFKALRVSRLDGLAQVQAGARMPQLTCHAHEIALSFVELVNLDQPDLPRQVFVALLSGQGLSTSSAHALFDGLLGHTRQVLQNLCEACEGPQGKLVEDLKKVAVYQLEMLV